MKLLASDFDGTLAFNNQIKEEDVKKIKEFQSLGHYFGMSTGRDRLGILNITNRYGIHLDFLVLASGAKLIDETGKIFYQKPLSKKLVQDIYKATQYQEEYMFFNDGNNCILNPNTLRPKEIKIIENINELEEETYSFLAIHFKEGEEDKAQEATDFINQHFNEDVIAYRNTYNVDIVAKGCSKGQGVLIMADHFNIAPEDLYVIGDSMNDIPMFDITNNAYSFYHIEPSLKKHVNYYVHSVAECIDEILKGK